MKNIWRKIIGELEQIMQSEVPREKRMKENQKSFREIWDTIKWANMYIIRLPDSKEREKKKKAGKKYSKK